MKLLEVNESQKAEYSHFVKDQESGSFLQSWEWGEWQKTLGREVYRFKIIDGEGRWFGSVQFIKMPLPMGKFYLYSPYGPIVVHSTQYIPARHLPESQATAGGVHSLIQGIKNKFQNAIFVRIEPKDSQIIQQSNYPITKSRNIQPGKTLIINLSKSEDQLLQEMHAKTRYNIRLAQKHGLEIQKEFAVNAGHGLFFREALELICKTADRQKFKSFPQKYYSDLIDFFALHRKGEVSLHLYKAVYKNKLLSSGIMIDYGKVRTYLFGGSSLEDKNVMAPFLMHFKAIKDAKEKSLSFYDFWGIETAGGKTPGFVRFKQGFGGEEKKYAGAYDIPIHLFGYKIYQLFRRLNRIVN